MIYILYIYILQLWRHLYRGKCLQPFYLLARNKLDQFLPEVCSTGLRLLSRLRPINLGLLPLTFSTKIINRLRPVALVRKLSPTCTKRAGQRGSSKKFRPFLPPPPPPPTGRIKGDLIRLQINFPLRRLINGRLICDNAHFVQSLYQGTIYLWTTLCTNFSAYLNNAFNWFHVMLISSTINYIYIKMI